MPSVEGKKSDENYDLYDTENEEYQRQLLRPAEIKEDVKLMEQRQRVSRILHSEAFHRELNKILDQQFDEGATCGGLAGSTSESNAAAALQEISNFLHPQARLGCSVFNRGATMPIIPICDIKITDKDVSKPEKLLRCKLASVYRLIDFHGWASGMMLHASVRINRESNEFLTNCHGLMNHEITASNLVKVNLKGEVLNAHSRIDLASWVLHSSIHQSDPRFKCVIHVRTPAVVAVSCMRSGLIKINEEAVKLGNVPIYEWGSASVNVGPGERLSVEQSTLTEAIGHRKCILVRNQGLLARGKTVEEAWFYAGLAVHACETQVRLASSVGSVNLLLANEEEREPEIEDQTIELQFESLMRTLDAAGHRTGYLYRHAPIVVDRKRRLHEQQQQQEDGHMADMEDDDEDVEIPPSSTSFATNDEPAKPRSTQTQWLLHMPNDYVREEITENGTRKAVSWRPVSAESKQTSGLVETCTSPNQFAPQGRDKHELKHQQQKVKGKYFRDETSAGHQSRVLRNLDQTNEVEVVPEEDSVGRVVLVGAVSRGIIDKKHRHDPSVYQSCFSPNPFDRVTDDDLKQYKRKVLGLPSDETEVSKKEISSPEHSVAEPSVSSPPIDKPAPVVPVSWVEEKKEEIIVPAPIQQEMHAEPAPAATQQQQTLTVAAAKGETIRSDTSGADLSHDDTEREGHKSGSGAKKKKKKLKEMFSFRKSKDKSK